ncbi:MAG TPA: integrase, partial [Chthoniobacteraceae bacterium]|nr:integrase [Chthoniobacteraceae bacterium]
MRVEIEDFILYLATERGLSDSYQLSTRISLEGFACWLERRKIGEAVVEQLLAAGQPVPDVEVSVKDIQLQNISDYLAHKKRLGLAPASIKLVVVALKVFFRWLHQRERIPKDPADVIPLPRLERYLPETMNELQVERLLDGISCNAPRGLRDRAILELLYASGLR